MPSSETPPPILDPDIQALWSEAIEEFQEKTSFNEQSLITEFNNSDIEDWAVIFDNKFHKDDKLAKVSRAVSTHMHGITVCVKTLCSTCDLTTSVFPAAAPASMLVRGFAKAFYVFAQIQQTHDDIVDFFKDMQSTFEEISTIARGLKADGKHVVLRRNVVAIFSCAMKILGVAIASSQSRTKKAIKDMWNGQSEISGLKDELATAKNNLDRRVDYATLSVVYDLQKNAERDNRNEILDWLSTWDYETLHANLLRDMEHVKNTGSWLLNSLPFHNWRYGHSSKLWYTGKPGAGKSVLAAIIIDEMTKTIPRRIVRGPILAYLHISYRSDPKPRTEDLLGAVLRQLVVWISPGAIPDVVKKEFEKKAASGKHHGRYSPLEKKTIMSLISEFVRDRPFYVILDAMDECPYDVRKPLIESLRGAGEDVRILVTARLLEHRDQLSVGFTMETLEPHDSDLDEYIDFVISQSRVLKQGSSDVIKKTVKAKGNGMFLLIKLHMNELSELDETNRILPTLRKLPRRLEESYSNALYRINSREGDLHLRAMSILAWMSYVFRDLHVDEMCAALAIHTNLTFDEKVLTSVCCGLVVVETDNIVRFVHYSARDFFRRNKENNLQKATKNDSFHFEISDCCVRYLYYKALVKAEGTETFNQSDHVVVQQSTDPDYSSEEYESEYPDELADVESSHPFAKYATEFLHQHLNEVPHTVSVEPIVLLLKDLLHDSAKRELYYTLLQSVECYPISSKYLDRDIRLRSNGKLLITPLHLAVFIGRSQLINYYTDSHINELDNYGQSPLIVALKRNLKDVVETLLSKGASVDLSTRSGHIVLLYAAQHDFKRATEIILQGIPAENANSSLADFGVMLGLPFILLMVILRLIVQSCTASPNPSDTVSDPTSPKVNKKDDILIRYQRLLVFAYKDQHGDLKDFLENDYEMTSWKRERFVEESGKAGDDEDSNSEDGNSEDGNSEDSEDDDYRQKDKARPRDFLTTACFLTVEMCYSQSLGAFLESGVDPNLKSNMGQPLIHRAAFRNNLDALEKLLEKKANIDLEDDKGRTALTAHAQKKHLLVLDYLRKNGADIEHTGESKVHELYRAAAFGNFEMMEYFLRAKVSPSITNTYGWAPFHEASANGHIECVKLLVEYKANPSPVSDTGLTPLDLVNSGEDHYDWPTLGTDSEHYLNGQPYRKKPDGQAETDRREDIRVYIVNYGAKTSDELYETDKEAFSHVASHFRRDRKERDVIRRRSLWDDDLDSD